MIEVVGAGLLTSVQDLGRPGHRRYGVTASGAADRDALRVANRLVGNVEGAAALECTLVGARFKLRRAGVIAITGGECEAVCNGAALPTWRPIACRAGVEIDIGRIKRGARCYVAFAGGIEVAPLLGSRSTDLRAGFGGLAGRALQARDRLTLGKPGAALQGLRKRLEERGVQWLAASWWVTPTEDLRGDVALLHLLPGRDVGALDPRVMRALRDGVWTVAPDSDRMGMRFIGPPIPTAAYAEQISSAVLPGAFQLPPDGRPILLGVDAQTVGGYPCVGHVIRADLGRAMQLRPGERVRGVVVTPEAADVLWQSRRRDLARMSEAIAMRLNS